jgi:light-regulated signal transduction histidine kinase (bacteriophytochrome)
MLSKDDFARRIALIQNFHSEQQALGALIDKLTDGYPVVTLGDNLIAELIAITAQELNDNDDFISWWLWEDVEKVVWVGDEDKQREISVRTVEELYDFLTEQMEG